MLHTKNVYVPADESDGQRILAERDWPQGVCCDGAKIGEWLPNIAPSDRLSLWYSNDIQKWPEFKQRYSAELSAKESLVSRITEKSASGRVTIVYSSKDDKHNNAIALKQLVEERSHT
jgi:uncharacterized protein YeaO (DUF488 family)